MSDKRRVAMVRDLVGGKNRIAPNAVSPGGISFSGPEGTRPRRSAREPRARARPDLRPRRGKQSADGRMTRRSHTNDVGWCALRRPYPFDTTHGDGGTVRVWY